jgi:hypothetical protein
MIRKRNINKRVVRSENELENINFINDIDELSISKPFDKFDLSLIPKSVSSIIFHYSYVNNPSEIPEFISKLKFYIYKNYLEELPNNIKEVEICQGFNMPVDKLGNNFEIIDFGLCFNQPIDNLPSSIEKIVLAQSFTHSINNLPEKLKVLYLHNPNYDYSTIKNLPKNLILLQIGLKFSEDLDFDLNIPHNYFTFEQKNGGINKDSSPSCDHFKNIYLIK